MSVKSAIEVYEAETRAFPPSTDLARHSLITDFGQTLEWEPSFAKWFVDRHVLAGRGERIAFHWEGDRRSRLLGDTTTLSAAGVVEEIARIQDAHCCSHVRPPLLTRR